MFHLKSRYAEQSTYPVTTPTGEVVQATTLPLTRGARVRGFHRRTDGQRLDLVANYYLTDPTAFWRLCDASEVMAPDALAEHDLLGIPFKRG